MLPTTQIRRAHQLQVEQNHRSGGETRQWSPLLTKDQPSATYLQPACIMNCRSCQVLVVNHDIHRDACSSSTAHQYVCTLDCEPTVAQNMRTLVDGGHKSPVNGSIGRNAKRLGQRRQASEVTRIGTSASPCPSIPWTEARQPPYQRMGQFFFCVLSFFSSFRVWPDKLLGPRTEKHRCGAEEVVLD